MKCKKNGLFANKAKINSFWFKLSHFLDFRSGEGLAYRLQVWFCEALALRQKIFTFALIAGTN